VRVSSYTLSQRRHMCLRGGVGWVTSMDVWSDTLLSKNVFAQVKTLS